MERTGKHILGAQKRDRKKEILQTRVKDRVTNHFMCTNQPKSIDGAYNLKTSHMISVFTGVVITGIAELLHTNVPYCSFVVPGDNSLKVYERVK